MRRTAIARGRLPLAVRLLALLMVLLLALAPGPAHHDVASLAEHGGHLAVSDQPGEVPTSDGILAVTSSCSVTAACVTLAILDDRADSPALAEASERFGLSDWRGPGRPTSPPFRPPIG